MFFLDDSVAYIPLIVTIIINIALFCILIIAKKKNGQVVSIFQILSVLTVIIGTIFSIINPGLSVLAIVLVAQALLLLPSALKLTQDSLIEPPVFFQDSLPDEEQEQEDVLDTKNVPEIENKSSLFETGTEIMVRAAESLADEGGMTRLLDFVNSSLLSTTKADGSAILLVDDFEDVISVKAFSGDFPPPYELPSDLPHKMIRVETNFRFGQFPLRDNIFGEIAVSGKPELVLNPESDQRIFKNGPEDFLKPGSYIFAPMKLRDTVIGVTAIARKATSNPFTESDFEVAKVLTDFASAAVKTVYSYQEIIEHSELTRESEIACKLQKTIHPKLLPSIPNLSLGHLFNTADGVCGDYYDVIPSRKDRISFILADVAGKGMNSLIIMSMIRAILRLIVNTTQSAATILGWANRGIAIENNIDHFASAALINYDSTNNTMEYSTAGTTPILYYSVKTGDCRRVSSVSEPIGVEKTTVYKDHKLKLETGDIVVMYSDGVVEAVNDSGVQYTSERLEQLIIMHAAMSGKEIANAVKTDLLKFVTNGHQHDDQTLLVIKIQ